MDQPSALALSNLLAEREITLEHRREAQQLVNDFTLGQMTRHYWGAFASSLKDLGLSAGEHVVTQMKSNDQATTLWVIPPRGSEAFLAVVERREGRLIAWSCRGAKGSIPQEPGATCPSGWVQIDRTEDFLPHVQIVHGPNRTGSMSLIPCTCVNVLISTAVSS